MEQGQKKTPAKKTQSLVSHRARLVTVIMSVRSLNVIELEMKTAIVRGNVISCQGIDNLERLHCRTTS